MYRIVRLLEPEICIECRFAQMATVEDCEGAVTKMIQCTRRDCDNWDREGSKPIKSLSHDETSREQLDL